MGRRKFAIQDFAPLLPLLEQPAVRRLADAAIPIKPLRKRPVVESAGVRLPVDIQCRTCEDGVPLEAVAARIRDVAPVAGLTMTPKGLRVAFSHEPTEAERTALRRVLQDRGELEALKRPVVSRRAGSLGLETDALRRALHDGRTPDAEWLRGFREYAARELIAPPEDPGVAPAPRRRAKKKGRRS